MKAKTSDSKNQDLSKIDPNIKNSYINNLFASGAMRLRENSMFLLYVLSGIIAYAHKIPFIGRIVTLASLYYGRTTIWQILVKIRKAFIVFNALIGVFMVLHTIGFSTDNILAGFIGMGHEYVQILYNFTSRIFNWFFDIFDHKIVPNVPSEPKNPKSFIPKLSTPKLSHRDLIGDPIDKDVFNPFSKERLDNKFSLRELYMKPSIDINIDSNPWYKDLTSWLWIGGIICTIGLAYGGYKFLTDPTFIETIFSADSTPKVNPNVGDSTPSPDITLTDRVTKGLGFITTGMGKAYSYTTKKLNPLNWFISTSDINDQFKIFLQKQNDMVTADRRYYPFTEINPILPWYKQLKVQLFGESVSESLERFKYRQVADRIYDSLQVSKGKFRDVAGLTPVTTPIYTPTPSNWIGNLGIKTPTIGTGVNTPTLSFNIFDSIHSENVQNTLNSLTPTPNNIPTLSNDNVTSIEGNAADWNSNTPIASTSTSTYNTYADAVAGIKVEDNTNDVMIDILKY